MIGEEMETFFCLFFSGTVLVLKSCLNESIRKLVT